VLEAMARGLPVACSDIPVLREVVGDAAVLFDPHDPASIAPAIARVTGDRELARELVRRGRERCRVFTWERTAEATLASYGRALGRD
jgi:glycosyltransferase involved in cell wall biosynthesis